MFELPRNCRPDREIRAHGSERCYQRYPQRQVSGIITHPQSQLQPISGAIIARERQQQRGNLLTVKLNRFALLRGDK